MKNFIKNFTLGEKILWLISTLGITAAFLIFDRENFLTLSREYICMVICFIAFLANDTYAYFSWLNIKKRQMSITASVTEK